MNGENSTFAESFHLKRKSFGLKMLRDKLCERMGREREGEESSSSEKLCVPVFPVCLMTFYACTSGLKISEFRAEEYRKICKNQLSLRREAKSSKRL